MHQSIRKERLIIHHTGHGHTSALNGEGSRGSTIKLTKELTINMPQMCIEGLSENWLFRELGGEHWNLLCTGLNTNSNELRDPQGNRLYASFVRIRIKSKVALSDFYENERVTLTGTIRRYGSAMYFSEFELRSNSDSQKVLKADLITIFSVRMAEGNRKLKKSESDTDKNDVQNLEKIPDFGLEYRLIKMQKLKTINLSGRQFTLSDAVLFEMEYKINPYYEVNGVGLLYFAAYPTISDTCEAVYFNQDKTKAKHWEQMYFTSSRDVMYYANCNLSDTIIYRLNSVERLPGEEIKISSSLYRKSDHALMARVFVIKKRNS